MKQPAASRLRPWSIFSLAVLCYALLADSEAWSHARLTAPQPRNNSDSLKTGPCGGVAKTPTPTVLTAGATYKVEWLETIEHPGRFILSIAYNNDTDFGQNIINNNIADIGAGVPTPKSYFYNWTVPNRPCDNCTLQLIQSMEENPAQPSYYYSCADIRIVAPGGPTPTPTPTPSPGQTPNQTPTPTPTQTPLQTPTPPCDGVDCGDGNPNSQGLPAAKELPKPGFGGCGALNGPVPPAANSAAVVLLLLPLVILAQARFRKTRASSSHAPRAWR